MFCWANGTLVLKVIAEALINKFVFSTMHGFSKWDYTISTRIAKVTVKMASETTQIHKGDNDDNEDEYGATITCSRSSPAAGTKCASNEISKTPKAWKSVRSITQHTGNIQTSKSTRVAMIV